MAGKKKTVNFENLFTVKLAYLYFYVVVVFHLLHRMQGSGFDSYEFIGTAVELSGPLIIFLVYQGLKRAALSEAKKIFVFILTNFICLGSFSFFAIQLMNNKSFPSLMLILIWLGVDVIGALLLYGIVVKVGKQPKEQL